MFEVGIFQLEYAIAMSIIVHFLMYPPPACHGMNLFELHTVSGIMFNCILSVQVTDLTL